MTNPMTLWTSLSPERQRHARVAIIGVGISWALAAAMAFGHAPEQAGQHLAMASQAGNTTPIAAPR